MVVFDYCVVEMSVLMGVVQEVKEEVQNHHPKTWGFRVLVVADVTVFLDCCPVVAAAAVVAAVAAVVGAAAAVAFAVE